MANIRQISPELAEKAQAELNEVKARIPQDIATLRDWIEKQPHLNARTNDQLLLTFLRGCKHSLEKAKQKIDYFHAIRSISPEIFLKNKISEKNIKLARIGHFLPLPNPLRSDGPCIIFTRYGGIDIRGFSNLDLVRNHMSIFSILMVENDNCVIGGFLNVIDLAHVTFDILRKIDLVLSRKLIVFAEKALPLRVAGVHVINIPPAAFKILKMIQNISPRKTQERVILHSSIESLYEYVPKEYLPQEYGGNNGYISECCESLESLMQKYKTYLDEDDQYKSNETLRVGAILSSESLFGLEGSFRQLEID